MNDETVTNEAQRSEESNSTELLVGGGFIKRLASAAEVTEAMKQTEAIDHTMEIIPGSSWVRQMTPLALLCDTIGKHKVVFERQDYGYCVRCKSELLYCWTN